MTFLDQVLAADQREEPPMRDASGDLVEVRVREPWALHTLTSDGANDERRRYRADEGAGRAGSGAAHAGLCRAADRDGTSAGSREKDKKSYFGALPRPYIDALMQFSPSAIPVVRAINTAPLVSMSGNVIDGVGLDRDTGLVHRIDPLLRACVPAEPPTEQDVRDAVSFLFDEWLVDVALDRVGKCVAIMLAMTLIERALLPERPAFFVTAGQRGGGKTTLVNMITLAALGRRAAAAAWSDNARGAQEGAVLLSAPGRGVPCLGQHRPRIDDQLARTSRRRSPRRRSRTACWAFPGGDGAVDHRPDLHRQFDHAARRHGESVADAGAQRRPPGPGEPHLRPCRSVGLDAGEPAENRARPLHAADRGSLAPPAGPGGEDAVQDLVDAWSVGRWNMPRVCSASTSIAPS